MNQAFTQMGGMTRTSALPGPNLMDGGTASKPELNNQPQARALYTGQTLSENAGTANNQAVVTAERVIDNDVTGASDAEVKAQQYARQRIAETLYANDSGSAMMRLNAKSQSPEGARFMNDLAVSNAMRVGVDPALGAAAASAQMYGG